MKFFKDSRGTVFAYEADGSQDAFIQEGLVAITKEEADALRFPPRPIAELCAQAAARIDADTDRIYADTIGSRAEEYRQAEADALQFKAAGYAGDVPSFVADYQSVKDGWTAQQAADDILATAASWRAAQAQIRAERLRCKELARKAADAVGIAQALEQWQTFVATARASLGLTEA